MADIRWALNARQNYLKTLEYLADEWGVEVAMSLDLKMDNILEQIAEHPQMYAYSKVDDTRKCVINKHNFILYKDYPEYIEIQAFIDARSDHNY
jgi:plasmid stabilization system protein ParE